MRKVFLDDLPRWESGINKGKIKWSESVSMSIDFIYEDIEGKFIILEYEAKKTKSETII